MSDAAGTSPEPMTHPDASHQVAFRNFEEGRGAREPRLGRIELAAIALYEDSEGLKWMNARNETRAEWRRIARLALEAPRAASPEESK